MDLAPLIKPCSGGIPQKMEEEWYRCQLSHNLPQAKKGRLTIDVSSGSIFLTKKKRKRKKEFRHQNKVKEFSKVEYQRE